jgi:hypothetical protein
MKSIYVLIIVLITPFQGLAQDRLPIIDVHMHALTADQQGPPPVAICSPFEEFPAWDPAQPYEKTWLEMLKNPPCEDPLWSPKTDEELMYRTIEVIQQYNVFGVLSGTPDRVATWMDAESERFYPGLGFQLGPDSISPDSLRALHAVGRIDVLAEVTISI